MSDTLKRYMAEVDAILNIPNPVLDYTTLCKLRDIIHDAIPQLSEKEWDTFGAHFDRLWRKHNASN